MNVLENKTSESGEREGNKQFPKERVWDILQQITIFGIFNFLWTFDAPAPQFENEADVNLALYIYKDYLP